MIRLMLLGFLMVDAKVAELSSSIFIRGLQDYTVRGNRSRCTDMVDRAANLTNSQLNFVPTLFWVHQQMPSRSPFANITNAWFCVEQTVHPDSSISCPPVTQEDIYRFTNSMRKCFARAVSYNLSIAITPRLEDGTNTNSKMWRNTLIFDPMMPYQQHSYMDVMLQPLANALKGVMSSQTKLWFALQGGMGASLFRHPQSYLKAMQMLKDDLSMAVPEAAQPHIKFGISSNYNKLCGCTLLDVAEPEDYLSQFEAGFPAIKNTFNISSIQAVFKSVDFIGVSSAVGLKPGFVPADLEHAVDFFDRELSYFSINLSQLMTGSHIQLHWYDFGVGGGGGVGAVKSVPARDATQAAKFPFVGMSGSYRQSSDPWMLYSIDTIKSPVREYASFFYEQATEYLWKQHEYKYPVDVAFLKNIGSWDIQGVHPESASVEGSYYFQSVVDVIQHHNQRVQRLVHLTESLGEECVKFLLNSMQPDFVQQLRASPQQLVLQAQGDVASW